MRLLRKLTQSARFSMVVGKLPSTYKVGELTASDTANIDVYNSTQCAIKIDATDISLVAKRNTYIPNMTYPQYEPNSNQMYHVSVDDNIYICLSNNNGSVSTFQPTGTLLNNITKEDGYTWVYVGKIDQADMNSNSNYITAPSAVFNTPVIGSIARVNNIQGSPVFESQPKYKVVGEGSNAIFDIVLANDGTIDYIGCANSGFGYTDKDFIIVSDNFNGVGASIELSVTNGVVGIDSFTVGTGYNESSVVIIGDGEGAIINATTLSGNITEYTLQDGGAGYTWAKAYVVSSENVAVGVLQPLPLNGKATDPAILLQANTWRVKKTLDLNTYRGYISPNSEINFFALVDQYNDQVLAGLSNPSSDMQLKRLTSAKEVYCGNVINPIIIREGETISLAMNVYLDD